MIDALLAALTPWGAGVIGTVQAWSTQALDAVMVLITLLGQEPFYLVLYAATFWCVGKRCGLRTVLLLLLTLILNEALKRAVAEPRPFLAYPWVEAKVQASGYAFPSGHAQTSATLWPTLAMQVRRRWFTALAAAMVLLVSFSRVYLGAHYPHDVLAGILLGLLIAAAWAAGLPRLRARVSPEWRLPLAVAAMAVGAVTLALMHGQGLVPTVGVAAGAGVGWLIEERRLRAVPIPGRRNCAARILLGMLLLGVSALAVWSLLPSDGPTGLVLLAEGVYALLGLLATWSLPALFVRLGWMRPTAAAPVP